MSRKWNSMQAKRRKAERAKRRRLASPAPMFGSGGGGAARGGNGFYAAQSQAPFGAGVNCGRIDPDKSGIVFSGEPDVVWIGNRRFVRVGDTLIWQT